MNRFQHTKKKSLAYRVLISIAVFTVLFCVFIYGINSISTRTITEQETSLKNALHRGVIQCYATEGSYPESLEYLKKHYGVTYDDDIFFVAYKTSGSNIMPDITIIKKGD